LKTEVSKESRNRYESIENLKSYLENDIPKLNATIKLEQEKREESDDLILNKSKDEFTKYIFIK
jgi:hypothetical protein